MNTQQKQQLWDDFLQRWPRENLPELTLEEYVSVNDTDTFTYWLETGTGHLGSIKGNTSAKFGIYKRKSEGVVQSGIGHGEVYSWRTRYGHDEESVFQYVKETLVTIANAAYQGDLEKIDQIDFAPLVKWKLAFLYQNQDKPALVNTFSQPMLEVLTGNVQGMSFPKMYKQLIEEKGEQNLLEFGDICWERAAEKRREIHQRSIFDQFSHIELFNNYSEHWSQDVKDAFCALVQEAHNNKLDVFSAEMPTGTVIRIGRKESFGNSVEEIFATFELTPEKIKFELRFDLNGDYEYSEVSDELYRRTRRTKTLAQFAQVYPITRKAYWPKNYLANNDNDIEEHDVVEEGDNYATQIPSAINQILYGPPGTGKTYHTIEASVKAAEPHFSWPSREELKVEYERLVKEKRIRFVTFHQSYGYEEFVEGLRAISNEDNQVEYPIQSGIFKQICEDATDTEDLLKEQNYVLVIDEINRGNISKIFGELITLIEPSKRKGEKEALELTLPHSGEAFSVPNNLHIIGTMNTADRSLAMMDTALRRRFDFIEMMPKPELLACEPVNGVDLQRLLEVLNQRIEILYDREHTLGHAFFMPVKELALAGKQEQAFEELVLVFKNKVIPLLEEYFFEDWSKIRLVLADNQKPEGLQFVEEQIQTSRELNALT
ncbi:McrB family protein [Vibrio diabolicus]|uniref:McrB family protein n=1 Tax=Vibrio diabolicus TaxID=50719 RepID=UPI0024807CA4|nr:AAA family ATPase [Vibrio diabolicus]